MDKPGLDNDMKFAGGIFSGSMSENEKQEPDGNRFFNYATLPKKNGGRMPLERQHSMEGREEGPEIMRHGMGGQDSRGISEGDNGSRQEPDASQRNGNPQGYDENQGSGNAQGYNENQGNRNFREYDENQGNRNAREYGEYPGGRGFQGYGEYRDNRTYQRYGGNAGMPPNYNCYNGGGYGPYGCMNCPNRGKQEHSAVIIMAIVAVTALVIAFFAVIFCLVKISSYQRIQPAGSLESGGSYYYGEPDPSRESGGWYEDIPIPDYDEDYYGEITDAIREDLDYSITWENYEYEGNDDNVTIAVDYPVISGDIPNIDAINDIIDDETEYFESYYEEYVKNISDGRFLVYSEGYVTYMDDNVMSVVFAEMIYTDYWTDYGLYCLNIDVENGIVLDNSSIMEIDNEFAVDFRKRCKKQNGTVEDLEYMSDQEIAYYLSQGGTSIMFYTPMGMEVGLNMGGYYVTVTYKDYEDFLQRH